jgi:dTDP-4-dehydrorhamnose 3,5-epimerase
LREDSPTYKQQDTFYINEKNKLQVLIPPGCVNGHLCLSDSCLFSYKLTEDYVSIDDQISIKWNDPEYNIFWPISSPILSKRDT